MLFDGKPGFRASILGCLLFLILLTLLSTSVHLVAGRKCVCTSRACKEAGVRTCKTKYSCYTELIRSTDRESGTDTSSKGCTEGATPLLCETKTWVTRSKSGDSPVKSASSWIPVAWPKLNCCDSHDYCNADRIVVGVSDAFPIDDHEQVKLSTWILEKDKTYDAMPTTTLNGTAAAAATAATEISSNLGRMEPIPVEGSWGVGDQEAGNRLVQYRDIGPLQLAALILAIAALISVLAACYVVTSTRLPALNSKQPEPEPEPQPSPNLNTPSFTDNAQSACTSHASPLLGHTSS